MAQTLDAQREARRLTRDSNSLQKTQKCEALKLEGNALFRQGDYVGAANYYVHGINTFGPQPILLSNLAATYLKLDLPEEAMWAANTALEFDPKMLKARYRRGIARKGLYLFKGALDDLEIVVSESGATADEQLLRELESVRTLYESGEGNDLEMTDNVGDYPSQEEEPWELYCESDTEDCKHLGNGTPCRSYNHQGCTLLKECQYSHGPDMSSVRDELGRNVCVNFLFDSCKSDAVSCSYSHDKTYLPENGWWNDPEKLLAGEKLQQAGPYTSSHYSHLHPFLLSNPKANCYGARANGDAILEHLNFMDEWAIEEVVRKDTLTPVPNAPFVLIIALNHYDEFTSIHRHLLTALKSKVKIVSVFASMIASRKALEHLNSPNLVGVLMADPGIIKLKYTPLLRKIVQYVKGGGSAVVGCSFSTNISYPEFDNFIKKIWGLDWKFGEYQRTSYEVNPANEVAQGNPSLSSSYSMKAVSIGNIQRDDAIYVPVKDARLQSHVFPSYKIKNTSESPAVCARIGKGLLSYLGDVNGEIESTNTILAMLGLLDAGNTTI